MDFQHLVVDFPDLLGKFDLHSKAQYIYFRAHICKLDEVTAKRSGHFWLPSLKYYWYYPVCSISVLVSRGRSARKLRLMRRVWDIQFHAFEFESNELTIRAVESNESNICTVFTMSCEVFNWTNQFFVTLTLIGGFSAICGGFSVIWWKFLTYTPKRTIFIFAHTSVN